MENCLWQSDCDKEEHSFDKSSFHLNIACSLLWVDQRHFNKARFVCLRSIFIPNDDSWAEINFCCQGWEKCQGWDNYLCRLWLPAGNCIYVWLTGRYTCVHINQWRWWRCYRWWPQAQICTSRIWRIFCSHWSQITSFWFIRYSIVPTFSDREILCQSCSMMRKIFIFQSSILAVKKEVHICRQARHIIWHHKPS